MLKDPAVRNHQPSSQSYPADKLFIGGEWVTPKNREELRVLSPATGKEITAIIAAGSEDIDRAVCAARQCQDHSDWPRLSFAERAGILDRMANALDEHAPELARTTTEESGIPFARVAIAMVARSAEQIRMFAQMGREIAKEEPRPGVRLAPTVRREPVGVVGIITPWNAPLPITHFSVPPALLAGCAVVLKPAPETPLHGQLLAAIYADILPPGAFNVVPATREASEALVRHRGVDKISFTGSTATGRRIATICGEQLKRCSLELGGKSAAIILDDADLDVIMPPLVGAAVQNNCQACVGQTRILAPRNRYDEVVDAFSSQLDKVRIGDPHDPETTMGPLISELQRDRAEGYIATGLAEGAVLVRGGKRPDGLPAGWYLDLTLFRDVDNSMRIAREEIFGPVFVVIPYDDEDDAIAIANDSDYGLAGSIWTADPERGARVAREIRTGTVGINCFGLEYAAPFGGFKQSGIGRQLGREGLDAFFELKTIIEPLNA